MSDKHQKLRLQESIIDTETVLRAVAEAKACKPTGRRGPLDLLADEPAMYEFLKGALLEIAGQMAINDCPPAMTRLVYREAAFLLAVTFNAVRHAHRDLYADLLPRTETDPPSTGSHADQDLSSKPEGGNKTHRSPKKESKP